MNLDNVLTGKVVLITGAARGLGRSMALGFARAGAMGVACFDVNAEGLAKVVAEIDAIAKAPRGLAVVGDVTRVADCRKAVADTLARFGGLHVLVNNAGKGTLEVADDAGPFWEADSDGWRSVIDTNVNGPFHMAKAATPHFLKQKWGRIINISKARESMHAINNSPYGPSKAALNAMSLIWAQDLLGTGVTVNCLSPGGAVDTDFMIPARRQELRDKGTLLSPEVIVPAAVWLASALSDGITGCRYIGKFWDSRLPPDRAAEGARDESIFRPPRRPSALVKTWEPSSLKE